MNTCGARGAVVASHSEPPPLQALAALAKEVSSSQGGSSSEVQGPGTIWMVYMVRHGTMFRITISSLVPATCTPARLYTHAYPPISAPICLHVFYPCKMKIWRMATSIPTAKRSYDPLLGAEDFSSCTGFIWLRLVVWNSSNT